MRRLVDRLVYGYLFAFARVVLRARRPLIIGVTGSVGKTTTKEVVAACLQHPDVQPFVGSVGKTSGNMNNRLGVPLVILGYECWPVTLPQLAWWLCAIPARALMLAAVKPYPKILVMEFAAGPKCEIARTAALAPPTIAAVTAIGPAHLEVFGTVERIKHEKGALVRNVPPGGLVILGADNSHASSLEGESRAPVVKVPGRGRELSENIARAVCRYLGVDSAAAERALADKPAVRGRLNVLDLGSITLIDDSFNANPLSMDLGLETLASRSGPGRRRVAVLGDMKELGSDSPMYHREIGSVARARADVIIGVGPLAREYDPDHWFATSSECADAMHDLVRPGDYVLVKGSSSVGLLEVVRRLKQVAPGVAA
jgi:UDP-N-acetylmuramoyl-tripeptide--D-alanyl-D-alanine ligase